MKNRPPVMIGTDRQLFVDDYWTAVGKGVSRHLHEPRFREAAIVPEHPWERFIHTYATVFRDGDMYRMWYRGDMARDPKVGSLRHTMYAESRDGIRWEKPRVGIIEFQGSMDNNLVWTGPGYDLSPFLDTNPGAPAPERYKAFAYRSRVGKGVVDALVSPDGLRWKRLLEGPTLSDAPFDTYNVSFWDSGRGEYVLYTRGVAGAGGPFIGGKRWIRRTTSRDFRTWTKPEPIDTGDAPIEHLYTNSCVQYDRAPGTYLMFPSRFVVDRSPTPGWRGPGVNDVVFMSSRDGLRFDRSFMEAFIRPGLDIGNWHERSLYVERGILQTSPSELSIYVMENSGLPTVRIGRYTLRTDGFVSVNAGYAGAELTTRPLIFEGGELELNYSTSAVGSVRVEIQDVESRPQQGFTLDDCPEKFGDEIEGIVRWDNGADVSALAGKPVRLRFALKDADIYAFRFRPLPP